MSELKLTLEELAPFCEGFSKDQLQQAHNICHEYQLTPMKRQIHFSLRSKKVGEGQYKKELTYLVTVDGLRGIAERGNKYEGQVGPFWCGPDGQWVDVWLKPGYPSAAKVGVNKAGFREPLYAVAKFEEYSQKDKGGNPTQMWAKMPAVMVAKCAEALALRRAFPDETNGLYTVEEMEQVNNPVVASKPPTTQQPDNKPATQTSATSEPSGITPSSFSMAGEPDPANPFTSSEDRKNWMVDVKAQLDMVSDQEGLDNWLAQHGGHMKWLGTFQLKAMNEQINNKRAKISNAEFDRAAREKMS